MTKSYAFLSLVISLIHAKWGIATVEAKTQIAPIGKFCEDVDVALDGLRALASAHEMKESAGKYGEYVEACKAGSNRAHQRTVRIKMISAALRGAI